MTNAGQGLRWASELRVQEAFETVKKIAHNKELCTKKGFKEGVLMALYNSDRKKARPVLLHIAADIKNSPWRGGDDIKYAAGAWMSGVCIIGQMAAEAGWKEFAPVLANAIVSEHCGGNQDMMSLLRSLRKIATPGDEAVIKAVRTALTKDFDYMLAEAALAAGVVRDKGSIPRLREFLDHHFMVVRRRAAIALGMLGDTQSAPKLRESLFGIRKREVLDHTKYGTEIWLDENMRAAAAKGLGLMKDKASLPALKKALAGEPVAWVREVISEAVKAIENAK